MNILALNPFKISNNYFQAKPYYSQPRFGLAMPKPLEKDTVSFGDAKAQTKKSMEKGAYLITAELAMEIQARKALPHERKTQLLMDTFGDLIDQGLISFHKRLKGIRSIREKATTNGWKSLKANLEQMEDVSGFCIVLNSAKAMPEVIKRFQKLLETRELEVTQAEYHRRAPKYKKNQIVQSYDSLKPNNLQTLKTVINKIQNPTTQIWWDVDSRSGYSGLHVILRSKDGEKSELQIMIMTMQTVKEIENLLYKIRNGKSVDEKYGFVEKYLTDLKPLPDYATEEEKKAHEILQSAITKYTQEAYLQPLSKPFDETFEPLTVEHAETLNKKDKKLIAPYDLNIIADLMARAEYLNEKLGSAGMAILMHAFDNIPNKGNSTDIKLYLDLFERIIDNLGLDILANIMETCQKISGECDYKTIGILVESYEKMMKNSK